MFKDSLICPATSQEGWRSLFNSTATKDPEEHHSELSIWWCWDTGQRVGTASSTVQPDWRHPEHSRSNAGQKNAYTHMFISIDGLRRLKGHFEKISSFSEILY